MPQKVKNMMSNRNVYIVIAIAAVILIIAFALIANNITKSKSNEVPKNQDTKDLMKSQSVTDPVISGDQQKPNPPTPPQLETPKIK
jgi:flagellar basal body-associated protein FliL